MAKSSIGKSAKRSVAQKNAWRKSGASGWRRKK